MSKIGRKPIDLESVQVEVKGQEVHYKGNNASGLHVLPDVLYAELVGDGKQLKIICDNPTRENKTLWGLHRALLANEITGAGKGFEQALKITGLGYKGILSGNKIIFSLGFSHKIDFPVPDGISIEIDKTGQNIKVKGVSRHQVGAVSSEIRALRPPEPYKGTGIKLAEEIIMRKAGKTKAAA